MILRGTGILIIVSMIGTLAASAQNATFSVSSEEVRVDVLVTENGKPVEGLRADDFEIFDNGIPQKIRYATLQRQMPISVVLVLDMSSSISGALLDHLKESGRELLHALRKEDNAGLILFNHLVRLGSPLGHDFPQIKLALDRAQSFGNSSLIDASYSGLMLAETKTDPSLLIVFSDGQDTFSWLSGDAVLEIAKRTDTVVYAASTYPPEQKSFLGDLTRITGGSFIGIDSTFDLPGVFLRSLEDFRQRYLLAFTPQGVPGNGWHKIDVRVKRRAAKIRVRSGYMRGVPGNALSTSQ